MDRSLFQLMLEWESQRFGFTSRNLHGDPLLKTELDWLHAQTMAHLGIEKPDPIRPHHLDSGFWKSFATHLYQTHRHGMGSIIQTTLHFLEDLQEQQPDLATWAFTSSGVLKTQFRELDRLLKVHQLLQETHQSGQFHPHPTERLDETLFREGWLRLQKEDQDFRLEDTFRLISRHLQQNRAYFKAQTTNRSVLLRLDPILLKLLREGDCLPLVLAGTDPRHLNIESCHYPLLEDE